MLCRLEPLCWLRLYQYMSTCNVFSVNFPVCVLCEPSLWDQNSQCCAAVVYLVVPQDDRSPGYIDQSVNGTMSTGRSEITISVFLMVVQICGLSRSCSLSRRPDLLWSLHHISSPTVIDLGSLVSGVVTPSSPSTLYILCSSSGFLLSHIRVDTSLSSMSKVYLFRSLRWYYMFYYCYHTMSSFIHCSMVGVVSVYPQIRKIIQSAFVSCIITMSRSSCTMAVLIAVVFVIAPCAFQ